ncbi:MAG TPA: anion transporter [Methylosinus sp.]|jgi:Na+/H+ antiporter NhaD/arsenite permease-like protein|uniref:anion transporter n=1 Tax=Methylosinus sp. TaxID=427 RepID=UPI002F955C6D
MNDRERARSPFAAALLAVALVFAGALAAAAGVTLLAAVPSLLSGGDASSGWTRAAAVIIFAGTYFVIALGEAPGLRLDRAGAALLGASLMVGLGVLPLDAAYRAIDFDTITLLLGMMIVVANLRLSGFFRLAGNVVVTQAKSPLALLAAIVLVTGAFSAFLVNDAICLVMTPLTIELTKRLKRDPLPYLLAVAMASNVGSVATITGNPQNMIIGGLSHIPYGAFAAALWPVAAFGLVVTFALLALFYPREFLARERLPVVAPAPARARGFLVVKSVLVTLAMMGLFFAGQNVAKVAIVGGALLLVTRHVKAEKVYREIDWPLLLMFVGLFIVVEGLETTVLTPEAVASIGRFDLSNSGVLALLSAILSNLVSNVPAVLALKPFVAGAADPQRAWLVIAMASTLAGNLTLIGSVANLIVAERARAAGVSISFWAYFKVGAPLTLITIAFGAWRLS